MRNFLVVGLLLAISQAAFAQSAVPGVTKINLAWVDGVYWNPDQLPGWGFFVDAQEETIFGAIYGYEGSDSTFITLQGTVSFADPLVYRGDVYFITNGGSTATDVGDFVWEVKYFEASAAANLTISSNILNASSLPLRRFVYAEQDKIDILTAADWNITTRVLGVSFGYHYGIFDDRVEEDGLVGALVVNNADTDEIGAAVYVPPDRGDAYGIYIEFSGDTDLFAVFYATDTEMFGRYWLLDPGESASGNGNYFHGATDTIQSAHQTFPGGSARSSGQTRESSSDVSTLDDMKREQVFLYRFSEMEPEPMFDGSTVQGVLESLRQFRLAAE